MKINSYWCEYGIESGYGRFHSENLAPLCPSFSPAITLDGMKWVSEVDPTGGYKINSILSCSVVAGCYHARTSPAAFSFTFNCPEQKRIWPQLASLPLMFLFSALSSFIFIFPFIWSKLPTSFWFERPVGMAFNDSAGVIFTKILSFSFGIDQLCSNKIGLFWNLFFYFSLSFFFFFLLLVGLLGFIYQFPRRHMQRNFSQWKTLYSTFISGQPIFLEIKLFMITIHSHKST